MTTHPTTRLTGLLALAAAAAAVWAGAAESRPDPAGGASTTSVSRPVVPIVIEAAEEAGFDWRAAVAGAAAGAGALGLAGAGAAVRRRTRRFPEVA